MLCRQPKAAFLKKENTVMDYSKHVEDKSSKIKTPNWETIAERVRRHLRELSSNITDDDIRNVRVELDLPQYRYELSDR